MSHRTRYLLFAALSLSGAGAAAWAGFVEGVGFGDPGTAKVVAALLLLGVVGCLYFLVHAFVPPPGREPLRLRFIPSPEVAFEFSAAEASEPVSAEAIRAALAAGKGFAVADDPGGWLLLTGTIGRPRWVKGADGKVAAERQFARLALRPGTDPAAIRPEAISFSSTETNLTFNASLALAAALGPLRIRVRGDGQWIAVEPEGLFTQLTMRLIQVRPPIVPFTEGPDV